MPSRPPPQGYELTRLQVAAFLLIAVLYGLAGAWVVRS